MSLDRPKRNKSLLSIASLLFRSPDLVCTISIFHLQDAVLFYILLVLFCVWLVVTVGLLFP